MQGDFDRITYDSAKHYISVLLQQGRVQLPSDFNEAVEILLRLLENSNLDEKGKSGSPNDGFKIGELIPVDHMDKIEDDNVSTAATTITPNSNVISEHFVMQEGKSCLRIKNATSLKREYKNKVDLSHARKLFFAFSDLSGDPSNTKIPDDFEILINNSLIAKKGDINTRSKDSNNRWAFCWIELENKAAGQLDLSSISSISFQWKDPLEFLFDFIAIDYKHPIIPWNHDYRHPYWVGSFESSKDLEILDYSDNANNSALLFLGQPNLRCDNGLTSFTWNYQVYKSFLIKESENDYISICSEILIPMSKKSTDIKISFVNAANDDKKASITGQQPAAKEIILNGVEWYVYRFPIADISDKDAATWVKSIIVENIPFPCEIGEIVATPNLSHDFVIVGGTNKRILKANPGKFYCNGKICKKEFHETYLTQLDYPDPYPTPTLFSPVTTDSKSYQVGNEVTITVIDSNANKDDTTMESINLMIVTDSYKDGILIQATQTGPATGIFKASIKIVGTTSPPPQPGNNEIKGANGDKITIIYLDKFRATASIGLQQQQPTPPDRNLLVYLDSWERHITTIEDETIKEVALGGPDTATRLKQICQTRFLTEDALEGQNSNDMSDLQTRLYQKLIEFTSTGTGRLSTVTKEAEPNTDPCAIVPITGYEGDNRLYRVEIHKGGKLGVAQFKCSDNNGSIATRITGFGTEDGVVSKGVTKIAVEMLGRDRDTMFKIGDLIEVVDDATDLADYTQNPTLEAGEIRQITDVDIDENTISWHSSKTDKLYGPLDRDYKLFRNPKVRKWSGIGTAEMDPKKIDAASGKLVNPQLHLGNGIMLDFSGEGFRTGDYWIFKARALPREIDKLVRSLPMGPAHHYCKLAYIKSWPMISDKSALLQEYVHDCRIIFPPLTEISASDVSFDNSVCNMHDQSLTITVQQAIEDLCKQYQTPTANTGIVILRPPTINHSPAIKWFGPFKHYLNELSAPPAVMLGIATEGENQVDYMEDLIFLKDPNKRLPLFKAVNIDINYFWIRVEGTFDPNEIKLRWWALPAQKQERQVDVKRTIAFNAASYNVGDSVVITVTDPAANIDPNLTDSVGVLVLGTQDPTTGVEIKAVETGSNTGIFKSTTEIKITSGSKATVDGTTIDLPQGVIIASYIYSPGGDQITTQANITMPKAILIVIMDVNNVAFGEIRGSHKSSDFNIKVIASNPQPNSFPGSEPPGVKVTLDPGEYQVRIGPGNYNLTPNGAVLTFPPPHPDIYDLTYSGDKGILNAGETKKCTIKADIHIVG